MDNKEAKTFVKEWLSNKSTKELAEHFNVSEATLYIRANKLRNMGVDLPKRHPIRFSAVKVDELNKLIKQSKEREVNVSI